MCTENFIRIDLLKEFELLSFLARHAGRVVAHKQILTAVWGPAHTDDTQYLRPMSASFGKALLTKRRWFNGGCFMRGGKYYFSVANHDPSSKVNSKSPNSQSKKTNGIERKKIRRPNNFKSDDWYEQATLSMTISANDQR